ncbi:MAG: Fpg/Nei family DNA glycosylase [Acidimicrobiia bacterium]
MPEGHTLHRVASKLSARFGGQPTRSSSPQGRFAVEAGILDGLILDEADAYGKHLFLAFAEHTVHVHLGLAGKLTFGPGRGLESTVRWRLETNTEMAELRGPAACRLLSAGEVDALAAGLGPDPLRADADPDVAWQRIKLSHRSIGALLMDQQVVAGVGNIYRAEVLYRQRLDPFMEGRLLRRAEWQQVWDDLVGLMRRGVEQGRIDTVRPEHEPEAMGRPPRQDPHGGEVYVYRRAGQPCLVCGTPIRKQVLTARNLFWCPKCQRRTRRRG